MSKINNLRYKKKATRAAPSSRTTIVTPAQKKKTVNGQKFRI